MCVCFTKSNRGISCTGWTTNVFWTIYVLDIVLIPLLSGCVFYVFISVEPLLSISEWSSESLMCLYFLTIEMFLVNTFPSLFLVSVIVGPFTLVTVNKSFVQWLVNLFFVPVCLTKTSSPAFNSVGLALRFASV